MTSYNNNTQQPTRSQKRAQHQWNEAALAAGKRGTIKAEYTAEETTRIAREEAAMAAWEEAQQERYRREYELAFG